MLEIITIQKKLMKPWGPELPNICRLSDTECSHPANMPGNIIPNAMNAVQKA